MLLRGSLKRREGIALKPTATRAFQYVNRSSEPTRFERFRSLHVATTLVVSFLDQLAVELTVLHLTTTWERLFQMIRETRKAKKNPIAYTAAEK